MNSPFFLALGIFLIFLAGITKLIDDPDVIPPIGYILIANFNLAVSAILFELEKRHE